MEQIKPGLPHRLTDGEYQQRAIEVQDWWDRRDAAQRGREEADAKRLDGVPSIRFANATPEPWEGGILWGAAGVGKTHTAVCRVLSVFGAFVGALELVDIAREIENERASDFEERRWRKIGRARHLVLDDLGARRPTEFAVDTYYRCIDGRWNDGLETLVTSNLSPSELSAVLGDRLVSRIHGFGPSVHMTGRDRRLQP